MSSNTKTKAPLSRDQWHRVTEFFEQAMGLPADARVEFVEKATKETPELLTLKAELLFLIRNSSAESFLEAPVGPRLAQILDPENRGEPFQPGDTVGDFEIVRLLGAGGFAKVFLARQLSLDREVALKISANQGQEAKTMAHLEHDHIIKVFSESVDFQNDIRFLCMQYVPGVGLEKVAAELGRRNEQGLSV